MPSIPDRGPRDFSAILGAAELPLIVGGQAVNLSAVNYMAEVMMSGYAGNAANARGIDLARVISASIWLTGPSSLQPILERLRAHGLTP